MKVDPPPAHHDLSTENCGEPNTFMITKSLVT
jgi:hypothetical protein